MANFIQVKDRRVIPNWRSFNKTSHLGELNSINKDFITPRKNLSIVDYEEAWVHNKTVAYAADLLCAASINAVFPNDIIISASKFIIENKDISTELQLQLANRYLNPSTLISIGDKFNEINSDTLLSITDINVIYEKIKKIKYLIRLRPLNSLLYVELSRYYTVLNNKVKAIHSMKIALTLSSNSRFVLRSAIRLYVHFDEVELAHKLIRLNQSTLFDPWLLSSEISLSTVLGRTSRNIKKGIDFIESKSISPFSFSELAASIGTVEFLSGSHNKSRKLFNKALIQPNDNTLAQIEWVSNKDKSIQLDPAQYNVELSFEALSLDCFHNQDYENSLNNAAKWFLDMPFSKRPIVFASGIATTILKDQAKAVTFLKAGLINHPQDALLLNNIAYSLALDNKTEEAKIYLNKISKSSDLNEITDICSIATRGLCLFREGKVEEGRVLYLEAIQKAKDKQMKKLAYIAILNYAREELIFSNEHNETVNNLVSQVPVDKNDIELECLKNDVLDLIQKSK